TLRRLEGDATLLVQSGKPVGVFTTSSDAPRVLIVNAMLVPAWGDWEHFRKYEAMGLTMYGQMTAGSWIYIGTQGILQGTYETFGACAQKYFGGTLAGRLVLSAGLGGMGGAQPLAVTLNAGVGLFVEIDRERIERRLRLRYVDRTTSSLDEALGWAEEAREKRAPLSIALHGNAAEVHPELARRGVRFDVVTDQTSAHDMLNGYIPAGLSVQAATRLRARDPKEYLARSHASLAEHMRAMLALQKRGAVLSDYGNTIREAAGVGLLARLRRSGEGGEDLQRPGGVGAGEGAARGRSRSPGLGLGRLAPPRDGIDARRLGRDRRLADPQRACEHGGGRHVGLGPPRRRRRHRLFDPRGHGRGRRRHPRRGAPARARADDRSGHRHHAPCRRRL